MIPFDEDQAMKEGNAAEGRYFINPRNGQAVQHIPKKLKDKAKWPNGRQTLTIYDPILDGFLIVPITKVNLEISKQKISAEG